MSSKLLLQKQVKGMEDKMMDLEEDLKMEKEARNKAEKLKRDLGEVGGSGFE